MSLDQMLCALCEEQHPAPISQVNISSGHFFTSGCIIFAPELWNSAPPARVEMKHQDPLNIIFRTEHSTLFFLLPLLLVNYFLCSNFAK